MTEPAIPSAHLLKDVQLGRDGVGPLLQRDYFCIIDHCSLTPKQLILEVRTRFCELPPPELVTFAHPEPCEGPMDVGDELDVTIRAAGRCRVRLVTSDDQSFTLATLKGHPEAGRITFGAYRHESGEVMFHIRSRARLSNRAFALGHFTAGEAMQTNTWTDFVEAVAFTFGRGIIGSIHTETTKVTPEPSDDDVCTPTFIASGSD